MRSRQPQHHTPKDILVLWLLLLLLGAVQGSFEVYISPGALMVEYGGSVWVNCSTTCQDPHAVGSLETSLTKAQNETKRGTGWVAFRLVDITEWVSAPMCSFACRGTQHTKAVSVSVYRAPERVELDPLPELELGRAYNLTCRVLNVAPVRHLTVTLLLGGQTLHTETFQNSTRTGADTVTVTHTITPRRWDHGQGATCHAALDLRPHGPLFSDTSAALELQESVSPTAKLVAIAAIATLTALLVGILACGLVQRRRTRRETRPDPGEAVQSRLEFEMAQASAERGPAAGDSLDWPEDTSQ